MLLVTTIHKPVSEERLANNLCTVWMGRHKLIANISRFQRNNNKGGNTVGVENINNPVRFGVSIGDSVDKSPAMILDDECLVSREFSNSLFGRVKEFASLANIKIADISIQYLGEYWILVKFSSQDARQSFRDSVSVESWFSILKEASSDFHCDKRIAWIEIEGIPFKLWTETTFKRIASRWGVFLSVDDQENSCFYSKRLCVHTMNTRIEMSRDVFTVGSIMRIPLLYQGEYSQWVERFMNYLEEQTDGEEMINSIKNGDQPLPRVTQVSIAGTTSTKQPPLKDKSMCNKTAKYLWDALARHMLGSEYGEQDRKAAVLYEYETFKSTEGELLLDTYIRYLQVINNLKKCGYSKDNYDKKVEKKDDEKKRDMSRVKCYNYKKEGHFAKDCKKVKVKDYEYYKTKMLLAKKDKYEQVLLVEDQAWMESKASSSSADEKISEVSYYLSKSESESEYETSKYYDNTPTYGLFVNHNGQTNQTVHMIMHSKDILYNGRKGIGFENPRYFEKAKDLRPSLYDEKVISLGYTLMFLTHSDKALKIEKFKRARENKIEFAYDYGNLNASYVNEKIKFSDDYFQEIINPDFEKIDSLFQQTSSLKQYVPNVILEKIIIDLEDEVVRKECDNVENPKVIALGLFKLSVSQSVSTISMSKTSCDSKNVENLDTFSSVRKPKHSCVIWKKKGPSNTSNVDLSSVSHLKLNKDVKRYSRKDLLSCNNSHLGETSSAYVCNDAMNVSCNSRMCDLFDENNLFIFDDKSVRISSVSEMPFRKKPRDSLNVCSNHNSNQSLPRTVHRWLPKMQPLAEPVAKWIPRITDSGCSEHITGNRALLTNFVEKFLRTVRFGNNDFAVIAGYGDVVIGSMTIKKVYYVEGL
nr:nucleotide-binding alpha-beta plait domain-containing protein [Tanacetum cinerariifolium]